MEIIIRQCTHEFSLGYIAVVVLSGVFLGLFNILQEGIDAVDGKIGVTPELVVLLPVKGYLHIVGKLQFIAVVGDIDKVFAQIVNDAEALAPHGVLTLQGGI
ncbi:hypothetical protein Barb6_03779 [Bacteroidales bacterium Barb6]|nr:hypothetical protein Barb6_03779 [Bacteroidales bacterium Barb6]